MKQTITELVQATLAALLFVGPIFCYFIFVMNP